MTKYNWGNIVIVMLIVITFTGIFTSCKVFIDPAAANSQSAIIAVVGEYLYAIIVLVLVAILWLLRPAGIALAVLGMLGLCDFVELSENSILLVCIGFLMYFTSFAPIKQYEPLVVISKHFKIPKKENVIEKQNNYKEFCIQLFVGFIMLIIEYSIFVK